jgi:hypothetical protein
MHVIRHSAGSVKEIRFTPFCLHPKRRRATPRRGGIAPRVKKIAFDDVD